MTSIVGTGLEGYIKRSARERALNRMAEAEIQARRISERAEKRAAAIRVKSSELAEEQSQILRQRTTAQAELEAQAVRVRSREAVLRSVWQQARERLAQLTSSQRLATITALLVDAAEQLDGGELALRVNVADAPLLGATVLASLRDTLAPLGVTGLTVDPAPTPIMGGVIVRRADHGQSAGRAATRLVDNSWDERLRLSYDVLREEIYAFLAEPDDTAETSQGRLP